MKEDTMRTSMTALLIAAVTPVLAQAQSPTWQSDYTAAQEKAVAQRKPLAIVFGQGAGGWKQLGGGNLSDEARRILAEKYVSCFVDTATPEGRSLARQFELNGSVGLVISDHKATLQAFWHEGVLSADALTGALQRYADPTRVVSGTDTNSSAAQTRYYPPTGPLGSGMYSPGFGFTGGGMSFGGGACRG
jgi:hypothetical protein